MPRAAVQLLGCLTGNLASSLEELLAEFAAVDQGYRPLFRQPLFRQMFEDSIRLDTIPHRHSDRRMDGQTHRIKSQVSIARTVTMLIALTRETHRMGLINSCSFVEVRSNALIGLIKAFSER